MTKIPQNNEIDITDLGLTRKTKVVIPKKADIIDNFIALISIVTYLADIVTDGIAAYHYYVEGRSSWFGLTLTFIVVPSIIMQLLSCKWYHEDYGEQKFWSIVLHVLQLGPVQRYCTAFWSGLKTLCATKICERDFHVYLSSWRDVTMLRLFEAFVESAPQLVLQLYILTSFHGDINWSKEWVTILTALVSTVSIAWSIVSYTHALRLCTREKGFSLCGYTFQVIYRLCMVASRVVALVLFSSEYQWVVFPVMFVHWVIMVYWLHFQQSVFCVSGNETVQDWLNRGFAVVMGFVHIFCFVNTQEGTSRQRVLLYYFLFFIENSLMIAAWYISRNGSFGFLEYAALSFVWGGFIFGLLSMFIFYKLFHPNQDITAGWLCCPMGSTETNENQVNEKTENTNFHLVKRSDKFIPVDVELSARSDISSSASRLKQEKVYDVVQDRNGTTKLNEKTVLDTHSGPRYSGSFDEVEPSNYV